GNCVVACPFGVPEINLEQQLMKKCDMCYDRSSVGRKPMCTTVCPSQALFFGTREEIEKLRPRSMPVREFHFGRQTITTKVSMMVPKESQARYVDVLDAMDEQTTGRRVALNVMATPDPF